MLTQSRSFALRRTTLRTLMLGVSAGCILTVAACTSSAEVAGSDPATAAPTPIATVSVPPQATITTPVPPPGGDGDVNQTVESQSVAESAPVSLSSPATMSQGVDVSLSSIQGVTAEAVGPGEVAGPAVAVTVQVTNNSSTAVPLDGYSVNLIGSDGQVAIATTGGQAAPLTGEVAPGQSASGTYVFTVAEAQRSSVSISVNDARDATTVVFTGSAA